MYVDVLSSDTSITLLLAVFKKQKIFCTLSSHTFSFENIKKETQQQEKGTEIMLRNPISISKIPRRSLPDPFCFPTNKCISNRRCVLQSSLRHSHIVNNTPSMCSNKEDKNNHSITSFNTSIVTLPNYRDPQAAYGSKTYWELIRTIIVLNLCQINFLVDHGSKIVEWSYRILGNAITNAVIRPLFFQQFCAGEDFKETTDSLKNNGIQSILDYCAEADSRLHSIGQNRPQHQEVHNQPARTYTYYSEAQCDRHRDNFLACIKAMRDVSSFDDGKARFMALKVTALANPQLLERVSPVILRLRELFDSRYVRRIYAPG